MTLLRTWTERVFVGGLAPLVVFGSRFAGNIILSRLLAPDEFGTAIAIGVVLSLGSLATDVALDRFVMIDGSARALAAAHLLSLTNGVLLAILLVVCSPLSARLFGVPDFSSSFAWAACISIIGAFGHLGIKQIQRTYNYGPDTIAQVVANLTSVVVLLFAATTLRNHWAIIVSMAFQWIVYVGFSHMLARSPYRVRYNKAKLRQALAFGLPLTLNGIGLAIMSQLDRVLVGYWFGVRELGTYAVMFSMSVIPTHLIVNVLSGPGFSFLLADNPDAARRRERYRILQGVYSVLTSLYALWMVLTLDGIIPLIYGKSFAISAPAHVLFVLIACLRLQRSGAPTSLLLASGRTKQLAVLNLSSGFGLLIAAGCIAIWPRLESMLVGIAIGEFISFLVFFTSLGDKQFPREPAVVVRDVISAIFVPATLAALLALDPAPTWPARGMLFLLGLGLIVSQVWLELYTNRSLREALSNAISGWLVRRRSIQT
ncbi:MULTISPECIES: oligosaccharide flippase family protein [Bradyrhizobium]|uniref:oligosaccharide flippase family protein n=1 Tax=Bradyrhizobium TaxID=374 RepID=UPI001EDB4C25|nr:oligosaccharide flippase family protein [Bradyrhizobium zhengyangense]